jgi:hypothetical protein
VSNWISVFVFFASIIQHLSIIFIVCHSLVAKFHFQTTKSDANIGLKECSGRVCFDLSCCACRTKRKKTYVSKGKEFFLKMLFLRKTKMKFHFGSCLRFGNLLLPLSRVDKLEPTMIPFGILFISLDRHALKTKCFTQCLAKALNVLWCDL